MFPWGQSRVAPADAKPGAGDRLSTAPRFHPRRALRWPSRY
jgi:hypothetical protein